VRPTPKDKLIVVACVSAQPMGFLINSSIRPWVQREAYRLAAQAQILAAEHSCLKYDSYVDCLDLYPFEEIELVNRRDIVSPAAQASIKAAVKASKTIAVQYKALILSS
jgi:hypothetical protein